MSVHISNQIIKKEWTDYNNHMNVAYYVLVFDESWELMLQKFKMGENSAKTTQMSTMAVESHITLGSFFSVFSALILEISGMSTPLDLLHQLRKAVMEAIFLFNVVLE